MTMEGLLWLIVIGSVVYFIYYDNVYKRTKVYKEKQIIDLAQKADQLLAAYDSNFQNTQVMLDNLMTRKEQTKFIIELEEKDDDEKNELMKKLMQPKESNFGNEATAQRLLLILDMLKNTKIKYIRLMERLKHGSVSERLRMTQDWNYYVRLFVDETSADPNYFHQIWAVLKEIEKRFDDKLEASSK